jgi:hypothetical protein
VKRARAAETTAAEGGDSVSYKGGKSDDIPRDVTHVEVHPSVRAIEGGAFQGCSRLTIVKLVEGLEEIGEYAFEDYVSISEVSIPNVVKAIRKYAFRRCADLTIV